MKFKKIKAKDCVEIYKSDYVLYLISFKDDLDTLEIKEKLEEFTFHFLSRLNFYHYVPVVPTEQFVTNRSKLFFKNLKESREEIDSVDVVENIIEKFFTREIVFQKKWIIYLNVYLSPVCLLLNLLITILNLYLTFTYGMHIPTI